MGRTKIAFICLVFSYAAVLCAEESFLATHSPIFWEGREFPGSTGYVERAENLVKMHFELSTNGGYTQITFELEKNRSVRSVAFVAKHPVHNQLIVRVKDAKDQTFQKWAHCKTGDWQDYRFDMFHWTIHFGGPNDGVLRQPIKSFSLLIDNANAKNHCAGDVLVKDMKVEDMTEAESAELAAIPTSPRCVITDFGTTDMDAIDPGQFYVEGAAALDRGVLKVDFSKCGSVVLRRSVGMPGKPDQLALTVEAGAEAIGTEYAMSIATGTGGKGFSRKLGVFSGTAEPGKRIRQTFTVPSLPDMGWTGMEKQKGNIIHYPLRLMSLTVSKGSAAANPMEIRLELAATTRMEGVPFAVRLRPPEGSEPPRSLIANVRNFTGTAVGGTCSIAIKDWEKRTLATVSTNLPAIPPERGLTFQMPLPAPFPGAKCLEYEAAFVPNRLLRMGRTVAPCSVAWTQLMEDAGDATIVPDSPWGAGLYVDRCGESKAGYERMERICALAQAAGIKRSRTDFGWCKIEPSRGEMKFDLYDHVVDTARAHGIAPCGLIGYWAYWTKKYTEEGCADSCTFLRAMMRHYKGRVNEWEISNEPNIDFWTGPKELYPVLLKMAYAAIKTEDPKADVLGCCTAGIDSKFIQMCVDAKAPFDVLTFHPYRGVFQERTFIDDITAARKQVGGRPVIITEMGWPTNLGATSERQQAENLARAYMTAVANGLTKYICCYDFVNDGWNLFYSEENFGIMRKDLSPKPAYRALATVCRTFTSGKPELRLVPLPGEENGDICLFRMGDKSAVWVNGEKRVKLTAQAAKLAARNLMGEPVALQGGNNSWMFEVDSGHPLFFDAPLTEVNFLSFVKTGRTIFEFLKGETDEKYVDGMLDSSFCGNGFCGGAVSRHACTAILRGLRIPRRNGKHCVCKPSCPDALRFHEGRPLHAGEFYF